AHEIPEDERDYYLERLYPSYGNLAPRDISSRAAKRLVDKGHGVGPLKNGVNLDFSAASTCHKFLRDSHGRTRPLPCRR
ncbi:MAG: hypothetical protein EBY96_07185, partial [Actinobacteria bacterium]|nr:hypothetical protein [Actinomycetota bacterium]